jgi:hypothetical protein
MAIDRLSVIRTDFPMSRRGYDRIAVDRHLHELAQELEALQRPSAGAAASAQVQSIIDAAEASAVEIERRAWEDAGRVQEAADHALARAREQVGALGAASRALRERVESLLAEVESLEGTFGAMTADAAPAEVRAEPQDTIAFDPLLEDEVAEAALAETPEARPAPVAREPRFGREPHEADRRTAWLTQSPPAPPAWTAATATQAAISTQQARESARLVALNMADGGQPREVTDRYLAELYAPDERAALLDEMYGTR